MERILIANRGEIACRIIHTIHQLGKQAIAVYSEADVHAPHCQLADTAIGIGPAPPQQSYLNMDAILHAATISGAEGIHPGYGFLAENATFARRCHEAGLVFIGPRPEAMEAMGDRSRARQIAQIELNTRLQVEHPVTELVTGIDLVAEQIRLAEGAALTWSQHDLGLRGAALACRIYAANPAKNFLPSPGQITALHFPTGPGLRIDSGITAGSRVTPYYDPLLAKIVTHGENRAQAIARMRQALADVVIDGSVSNISLHQHIMDHTHFQAGTLATDFLSRTLHPQ